MRKFKLDEKDYKILRELERDGKKSLKSISESLKLSMTSVFERIKKLEKNKVIVGYKAVLDPEKVDKGSSAFVFIKAGFEGDSINGIAKKVSSVSGVSEVFIVNGRWDMVAKLRAGDEKEISKKVLEEIRKIKGISELETAHVWGVMKETTGVL